MKFVNESYDKPLNSSMGNFVNFVKINTDDYSKGEKEDLEWLARRVASNMYYSERNIETAKSDYIALLGKLIKHGILFDKYKDLPIDFNYPY